MTLTVAVCLELVRATGNREIKSIAIAASAGNYDYRARHLAGR